MGKVTQTFMAACVLALCGCDACPVDVGDIVKNRETGLFGDVVAIRSRGAWSSTCRVGVVWDGGSTSYEDAWRLKRYSEIPLTYESNQ